MAEKVASFAGQIHPQQCCSNPFWDALAAALLPEQAVDWYPQSSCTDPQAHFEHVCLYMLICPTLGFHHFTEPADTTAASAAPETTVAWGIEGAKVLNKGDG